MKPFCLAHSLLIQMVGVETIWELYTLYCYKLLRYDSNSNLAGQYADTSCTTAMWEELNQM